ncbi:MAG TPA: hypothetical protein VF718_06600 [Allosphingosinicella sp.]|jgi:hypothetical protein
METVAFTLPTLASSGMTRDDQSALLVNQATAVIVSAWLNHKNVVLQTGTAIPAIINNLQDTQGSQVISESELVSAINAVQAALRTI